LVHITVGANESFDAALRRFNKKVQQEGIITEARRRSQFDKPSVLRKKKAATKRRKARRAALKAAQAEERAL
jgi:small subunit ribosomal protein S21